MKSHELKTLIDIPLLLQVPGGGPYRFPSSGRFRLPVLLTSRHSAPVRWSAETPLTLSYRWLDLPDGTAAPESERTYLPTEGIEPGRTIRLMVEGVVPAHTGHARLCLSLILEWVHWAADISSPAFAEIPVLMSANFPWPKDGRRSPGGKALRGGLFAAALREELEREPLRPHEVNILESASSSGGEAVPRDDPAAEDLTALAIRQQRRIVDLLLAVDERDAQIRTLEQELHRARRAGAVTVAQEHPE